MIDAGLLPRVDSSGFIVIKITHREVIEDLWDSTREHQRTLTQIAGLPWVKNMYVQKDGMDYSPTYLIEPKTPVITTLETT